MNEMKNGLPDNFESLSRLEALREAVGEEVGFWSQRASELGDETRRGQAALEAMDYWAGIQMNMWSDDTNVLDAIEANLRAARASRTSLQEVA